MGVGGGGTRNESKDAIGESKDGHVVIQWSSGEELVSGFSQWFVSWFKPAWFYQLKTNSWQNRPISPA